MIVNSKNR